MLEDDMRFPCQVDDFITKEVHDRLSTDPGVVSALNTYKSLTMPDIENRLTLEDMNAIDDIIRDRAREITKELIYIYYSKEESNDK